MNLQLNPMNETEFNLYMREHLKEYARDRMITDYESQSEAEIIVNRQHSELLPSGFHTPAHYFFDLVDGNQSAPVGRAWLKVDRPQRLAWLFHIEIRPDQRRKGYASAGMKLLQEKAKELGARVFWLNVMGHNEAAQKLYRSLNMTTVAIHMNQLLS